jgi:hypothetical protein
MSFFTTSFRVPFPKAQLKEDNDEQIRNLLDAGIYPARLVGMRRGGVRALYGEKIAISPGTRCKCNTVAADQHTATASEGCEGWRQTARRDDLVVDGKAPSDIPALKP